MSEEYIEHRKNADQTSIWSKYTAAKDGQTAKCKICSAILKTTGGSTTGLHTHLLKIHSIKVQKAIQNPENVENDASKQLKKRKLTDYYKNDDNFLDAILARMIAKDGFPFNVFVTSTDLRNLLIAKGFKDLPKHASTVRNHVMKYGETIKEKVTSELKQLKENGERFSISFDEWTAISNKRFLNVIIHSAHKIWNLGLVRIHESFTAEICVQRVKKRLQDFGIDLELDIIAVVTDGPNVMRKMGTLIKAEHQLCFAHAIHLAVCNVLYKKIHGKKYKTIPILLKVMKRKI